MPSTLASHLSPKRRTKLGRAKIEVEHNLSLIVSKGPLSGLLSSCGCHNEAIVFDEPAVERSQPIEASNFRDEGRSRPTLDSHNLRFINFNSLTGHKIAKKDNLRSE